MVYTYLAHILDMMQFSSPIQVHSLFLTSYTMKHPWRMSNNKEQVTKQDVK